MADMTSEEVDAKLVANEARSDAQVAAILAKIDNLVARMEAMEQQMRDIIVSMNNLKKTVILTGISSVLAILFGTAGFNAALVNNMASAYQSGKETGQWQSDLRKQSEENRQWQTELRRQAEASDQKSVDMDKKLGEMQALLNSIKQERESGRR
ncbi:hypothetical protein GJ698_11320 [Pseudoduganella sp. FT26W]|uniref:Uncharacterized protein n=1 Tax=Duganella aquatilis TaxID=2666082 RepID=A0A844CV69_9BURK|nr:hypothetical protein [Duganella aquatilis]MRW84677.1 hypothetical protein [Duganella aquatilis]